MREGTPSELTEVRGVVVRTLARGRHLWADGDLPVEPGSGRYLLRPAFGAVYRG